MTTLAKLRANYPHDAGCISHVPGCMKLSSAPDCNCSRAEVLADAQRWYETLLAIAIHENTPLTAETAQWMAEQASDALGALADEMEAGDD